MPKPYPIQLVAKRTSLISMSIYATMDQRLQQQQQKYSLFTLIDRDREERLRFVHSTNYFYPDLTF